MFRNTRLSLIPILAIALAGPVLAAADPTLSQVYEAARTGHVAQAQQMMARVLQDHPTSAKAHYVAAELYARQHDTTMARKELDAAEALQPGLPFADAASVGALQRELSTTHSVNALPVRPAAHSSFPWGTVVVVLAGVGVLWLLLRRRTPPANVASAYSGPYPVGTPTAPAGPVSPAGTAVGPSIGSGIAGGLASGLAVGAGVVAGEEIARHLLGSGEPENNAPPAPHESVDLAQNDDLGGQDFGVEDASSWDDDPGGLGGGSDDWT